MKKRVLFLLLLLPLFTQSLAQTGIGTTSPNDDAVLEISSEKKGVLIPRISLKATTSSSPMSTDVQGMIVFNTATTTNTAAAGNPANNVSPGFYYNDGSKWERVVGVTEADISKDAWINDNNNTQIKLGTLSDGTSSRPAGSELVAKDNGNVGIGTTTPSAKLAISGNVKVSQISKIGEESNLDSIAVYGLNGELRRIDLASFFNERRESLTKIFATKGDGQSISSDISTKITGWNTTQIENATIGGDWKPTTGEYTVSDAGWYRVTATLTYEKGSITAGNEYNVQVRKNGQAPPVGSLPRFTEATNSSVPEGIAINTGLLVSLVKCAAGDKLSVWSFHNRGSSRSLIVTGNPSLCTVIIEQL